MCYLNNKELDRLEIIFENCEVYEIPSKGVEEFSLYNIRTYMQMYQEDNIVSTAYSDDIKIVLNEIGMNVRGGFDDENPMPLKERVSGYRDITYFNFHFKDGTDLCVEVEWENSYSGNALQYNDLRRDFMIIAINKKNETSWLGCSVPSYVAAALSSIDGELDRVMWNINQQEYDSPFSNSGNKYKNSVFEVEAYDWNEDSDQQYNFKWNDYEVRWYKYCGRGMESNREISPQECAQLLDECLKSLKEYEKENDPFEINDYDDFSQEETHYCVQCGEETNYKELRNGEWGCKKCLDSLGKEQNILKKEIEASLLGYGASDYKEVAYLLQTFINILKFAKKNTSIETLEHLITGLEAININIKMENGLLDKKTQDEINEILKKW